MTHIGHIDKEKHAEKALELFYKERDGFVRSACHGYTAGVSPEQIREGLVRKIKSRMEDVLFEHLKRTGDVRGSYRHQYTMGYVHTIRREPRKSEVPSEYRDIEKILPIFQELVNAVLVDAGKRRMISAIEDATKEALEGRNYDDEG